MTVHTRTRWAVGDAGPGGGFHTHVAAGVQEAGGALLAWLYGGDERASAVISSAVRRPTSEFASTRAVLLLRGGRPVGGYVAMPGSTLLRCRAADTRHLIAPLGSSERQELVGRLRAVAAMQAVRADEYYLSKLWVEEEHRGRGFGRALLERVLAAAARSSCRSCRLEVALQNRPALSLYRSMGFVERGRLLVEALGTTHLVMTRGLGTP